MPDSTYIAEPLLEINGSAAPAALMEDLLKITVEENLHLPGAFTLIFRNAALPGQEADKFWAHEDQFAIGHTIKIGFRSSATDSPEFEKQEKGDILAGEITAIEAHFTTGAQAPIIIRGYDASHRMHRGRFNRSFQNMTDSDIVKKIASEVGIQTKTIDDSGAPHDYIFQQNQTNMAFLRSRAARNGFEFFVQDGKLNFRKPKADGSLELTWLKELSSFRVSASSAQQVSAVEVRGWDYSKKQPFVASKTADQILTETDYGKGTDTSNVFEGKPNQPTVVVVDQPVFSQQEADTIAQVLFDELSGEFVQADAQAEGNPKIRPGHIVKLQNMGKYSGKYYITEARHLFVERLYTTTFSVRGLRGNDLLSVLSPPARPQAAQTLLVGIVTENNDPEKMGRVRVKCPTLTEEHESNWARVVSAGAGAGRGFDCLPEIDDEVLVAFEHGDIRRPYVIGSVWNGQDKPPESVSSSVVDGKVRLRTLKTRTGHTLQFVEEDKGASKKGIYIDSVCGHQIYINDSEAFIEIKTNGGHQLKMEDTTRKITMKSTGTIVVEAPQKIALKVSPSTLELTPAGIEIKGMQVVAEGKALVRIQGGLVDIMAQGIAKVQAAILKLN